jgi:hypothetical protein
MAGIAPTGEGRNIFFFDLLAFGDGFDKIGLFPKRRDFDKRLEAFFAGTEGILVAADTDGVRIGPGARRWRATCAFRRPAPLQIPCKREALRRRLIQSLCGQAGGVKNLCPETISSSLWKVL